MLHYYQMDDCVQLSTGIHKINTFMEFHKLNKTTCFIKKFRDDTSYIEEIYKGSDCDILKEHFKNRDKLT